MAVQGTQLASVTRGARHDGVTGVWYGKAPGLDRASDALRHANLMGTHHTGGALALVGDDPAAKSSTVPSGSEAALADLAIPTLYPADPAEIVELGLHAVALSRAAGTWAALKIVTAVADGAMSAELGGFDSVLPDMRIDGKPWRHTVSGHLLQPTVGILERDLYGARLEIARRYAAANRLNRIVVRGGSDEIGIVASGKTWLDLRQALAALNLDDDALRLRGIRLLKVGMVWPLEPQIVREFASGLREIVVVEETARVPRVRDQGRALRDGGRARPCTASAARTACRCSPRHGELDSDTIAVALARRLGVQAPVRRRRTSLTLAVTPRTPYFCSGCPHNTSTKPADGSLVGAGIGCHAMVLLMDDKQVGEVTGLTQMGGEGTQWIGMAPFVDASHFVQNLGDGTFHHSGSLAIRAAVAASVNITYKLLHNGTVAMTGGQDAVGALSLPQITRLLAAEGVARTIVTADDPKRHRGVRFPAGVQVWDRSRLDEAQRTLAAITGSDRADPRPGVRRGKRRKRKKGTLPVPATRIMINERVCEGCGDCGAKSNCLSVQPVDTEFGRKTHIDQSSCNLDFSCVQGDCPAFLEVTPGTVATATTGPLDTDQLPARRRRRRHVALRIAGIGGTGVVTSRAGSRGRGRDRRAARAGHGPDRARAEGRRGRLRPEDHHRAESRRPAAWPRGECDLYLGADLLAAADPATLAVTDPDRTVAVVSTAKVPTGHMVVDISAAFPEAGEVTRRIGQAVSTGIWLDARALSEHLFGSDQFANMLLAGAAFQSGALPLPAEAIEQAITLNGVAVEKNIQAFRWGRQAVADPAAPSTVTAAPPRRPTACRLRR